MLSRRSAANTLGSQGKKYTGMIAMPRMPWNCGVRPSDISGFEKFEGVGSSAIACTATYNPLKSFSDPAEFVNWGYAVASVDERGSGNSEGAPYRLRAGRASTENSYPQDTPPLVHKLDGMATMSSNSLPLSLGATGLLEWQATLIWPSSNTLSQPSNLPR